MNIYLLYIAFVLVVFSFINLAFIWPKYKYGTYWYYFWFVTGLVCDIGALVLLWLA